jgi:hypothetical protein
MALDISEWSRSHRVRYFRYLCANLTCKWHKHPLSEWPWGNLLSKMFVILITFSLVNDTTSDHTLVFVISHWILMFHQPPTDKGSGKTSSSSRRKKPSGNSGMWNNLSTPHCTKYGFNLSWIRRRESLRGRSIRILQVLPSVTNLVRRSILENNGVVEEPTSG